MQIAVLTNSEGFTSNFSESGEIKVFDYAGDHWEIAKTLTYDITDSEGMCDLRSQLKALGDAMTPCRNLVAAKLIGLAYTTYEVMGFQLWEIEGKPEAFLDQVRLQEIERIESETRVEETPIPEPCATDEEGVFELDLEQAKIHFTSKQVLYPALKEGNFKALKVYCSHIPPWFDRELGKMGYKYSQERAEDRSYIATIIPL